MMTYMNIFIFFINILALIMFNVGFAFVVVGLINSERREKIKQGLTLAAVAVVLFVSVMYLLPRFLNYL